MSLTALAGRAFPFCLLLAACRDAGPTLSAPVPTGPSAPAAALACTVVTRVPSLSCTPAAASARPNLMLGGQGVYLRLASSGTIYDAVTHIFRSDVTIQNLLPGPMGTPDGTTVYGMKVFFLTGPTATRGSGAVRVANPDGVGAFTAAAQPYFHYGVILASGAVSAPREWRFQVDPGVERFEFMLAVETRLPIETGVLRWTTRTLCDACALGRILHVGGDTLVIAGSRGGAGLLLRSFDAGATWDSVRVQLAAESPLSISTISGTGPHLYALVRAGKWNSHIVLRSDDMGLTWDYTVRYDPSQEPDPNVPPPAYPEDLYASGEDVFVVGIGCGDWWQGNCWESAPFVVHSTDGLRTRTEKKLYHAYMTDVGPMSIWGSGPNDVYVVQNEGMDGRQGWDARILRSTDGGQTWGAVYDANQYELGDFGGTWAIGVVGTGNGHLWILVAHLDKTLGSSTDWGHTWTWENVPVRSYHRMWAAADDQLFVLGPNALLRLDGDRWLDQPIGLPGPYSDISGTSVKNVFITTGTGRVLHGTR